MMKRIVLWALTVFLTGMFLFAGALKLSAQPMMVAQFGQIGLGQWFRVFTGTLEVTGALLVLVPATAAIGALLLAAVMVGAIVTHLFIIGGSPLMAVVLLAIAIAIAYLRRQQISSLVPAV
jgi:putative oxidoreductase